MQEGLTLIWVVSLAVTFLAWLYLKFLFAKEGKFHNRRKITGCEWARQILDKNHLNRTAIHPSSGKKSFSTQLFLDQLLLPSDVYHGTCLIDLARSLRETHHFLERSHTASKVTLWKYGKRVLQRGVLTSWILILASLLFFSWNWVGNLGEFLFVAIFFFSIAVVIEETHINEKIFSNLFEDFIPEERVRIVKLLHALKWTALAEIFQAPFSILLASSHKTPIESLGD